jgi:hypothetical protein
VEEKEKKWERQKGVKENEKKEREGKRKRRDR